MTYNVFSGTLNPTHFTSLHFAIFSTNRWWRVGMGRYPAGFAATWRSLRFLVSW